MKKQKELQKSKTVTVSVILSPAVGQQDFSVEAIGITALNKTGEFGILPRHTNFITVIFEKITIHTTDKKKVDYSFSRGVLEASNNQIKIFLGI